MKSAKAQPKVIKYQSHLKNSTVEWGSTL